MQKAVSEIRVSQSLHEKSKDELIGIINDLRKRKKFGLVWEDKPEQIIEGCTNKLPVIQEVEDQAIELAEDAPTNIILEGDNYHALQVLSYTHGEKVDAIYIDPPYNRGKSDFVYNDYYVDKEDAFRHSKWLSFMEKRLKSAKNLMRDTGAIFISIDENEQAHLVMLCNEIFGENNYLGTLIWRKKSGGGQTDTFFVTEHEYVLAYRKTDAFSWVDKYRAQPLKPYSRDKTGEFTIIKLAKWGSEARRKDRPTMYFPITDPDGNAYYPIAPDGSDGRWRVGLSRMEDLVKNDLIFWKKNDEHWVPYEKNYLEHDKGKLNKARSILYDIGETGTGTKLLTNIFGKKDIFQNPKPIELIAFFLTHIEKCDIVLDFFAGSGTTGHAVLELNKEDGGNRQFILCTNNENNIAEEVTYPRIKNVIEGYADVEGIPANLRYFKTEFVERGNTTDQTRVALVERATDMIRIRENTFDTFEVGDDFSIFTNGRTFTIIILDPLIIDEVKHRIKQLPEDYPINIYIFSLSNDTYQSDFADLDRDVTICPIPETILEVYKKICKADVGA